MSFLVNRLKVVAVEVLDAIEELKLRTGQPLARFELQAHKLKSAQRVRSLEEPIRPRIRLCLFQSSYSPL